MEHRGVTRPMARQAVDGELEQAEEGSASDLPSREDRLRAHHRQVLWVPWVPRAARLLAAAGAGPWATAVPTCGPSRAGGEECGSPTRRTTRCAPR